MTTLRAPAKLTWFLEVTGRRANGYHELRSEMTTLALADELRVSEGDELVVSGDYPAPLGEDNLVRRALSLVGRCARVELVKRIPPGGGLGGGSADAGAILRWAGGVDPRRAVALGGDVPFCQLGGRALVEGVGELLTPLRFVERPITLILADFGVSTADCYRAYDELVAAGRRPTGRNHLEPAARLVEPRVGRLLDWARAHYGEVTLAGSGSTLFVDGHVEVGGTSWDATGPDGAVHLRQTTTKP